MNHSIDLFQPESANAFSNWVEIPENTNKGLFGYTNLSEAKTEINFTLNGYEMDSIDEQGDRYQKISYLNEGEFIEV